MFYRISIVILFLFTACALADTIHVPSEYNTIQAGIDTAADGDTVLVADGTYTGTGNKNIDFGGKAIVVMSENGAENCIIDCENSGRGFYFHSEEDSNSIIYGFKILNGIAQGNYPDNCGGGIYCNNSNPIIENCIITENSAVYGGGGIGCFIADPIIKNCSVNNNSVIYGGGIACLYSNPIIINTLIYENSSADGGGVYIQHSNSILTNCTIINNNAGYGGGIKIYESNPIITNSIITDNLGSGGINFTNSSNSNITYCDFNNNQNGNFTGILPANLGILNSVNANGDSCDAFFNIFEDPLFYSTFGDSAFYLTENSPCIDAGDPESPLDPDSTIADIGAIYYNKAPAWIVSSQDSLFFPPLELGMDSTLALLFNNPGNDTLEFYEITTSNPVFTIDFPAISAPIPPGGTSDTCRVTFTPEEEILYEDTLFVLCNAFNAVNDTFVVYLHGEGGIVPDTVRDLTIESIYPNAVLNWSPVTASIYGSPIIVNCYLIFFSEEAGGPFYFLDVSFDTTYTHDYVVQFSPSMFYNVEAYIGEIGLLEAVSAAGERLTRSEVYELLK